MAVAIVGQPHCLRNRLTIALVKEALNKEVMKRRQLIGLRAISLVLRTPTDSRERTQENAMIGLAIKSSPRAQCGAHTASQNAMRDFVCMALLQRPLAVAVGADDDWDKYHTGIMDTDSKESIDHAVLAFGYGYYDGNAYWKIKDSWGSDWGLGGYILLARGGSKNQNHVMDEVTGVYVYGPYNPSMYLTDASAVRLYLPTGMSADAQIV